MRQSDRRELFDGVGTLPLTRGESLDTSNGRSRAPSTKPPSRYSPLPVNPHLTSTTRNRSPSPPESVKSQSFDTLPPRRPLAHSLLLCRYSSADGPEGCRRLVCLGPLKDNPGSRSRRRTPGFQRRLITIDKPTGDRVLFLKLRERGIRTRLPEEVSSWVTLCRDSPKRNVFRVPRERGNR